MRTAIEHAARILHDIGVQNRALFSLNVHKSTTLAVRKPMKISISEHVAKGVSSLDLGRFTKVIPAFFLCKSAACKDGIGITDTVCTDFAHFPAPYAGGIATVHLDNGHKALPEANLCPPLEEAKANGHLIAAAPDLYSALTELLDVSAACEPGFVWGSGPYNETRTRLDKAQQLVRAALSKARGNPLPSPVPASRVER